MNIHSEGGISSIINSQLFKQLCHWIKKFFSIELYAIQQKDTEIPGLKSKSHKYVSLLKIKHFLIILNYEIKKVYKTFV